MPWYVIERKRVVAESVYLKARDAAHASQRATEMDWEGETGTELVRPFKDGKPRKIDGIPRWLWEDLGYPDDEKIAS